MAACRPINWRQRAIDLAAELAALRATAAPVGVSETELAMIRGRAEHHIANPIIFAAQQPFAAATLRLLDAHAALVSHGDGVAAQLVEVTRERDALLKRERENLEWTDATPDEEYVERILRAHLDVQTRSWASDNLAGLPPTSPLVIAMNEHAAARARLLQRAIAALSATRSPVPPPGDTPDGGAR
jgi:hypothetical protein